MWSREKKARSAHGYKNQFRQFPKNIILSDLIFLLLQEALAHKMQRNTNTQHKIFTT